MSRTDIEVYEQKLTGICSEMRRMDSVQGYPLAYRKGKQLLDDIVGFGRKSGPPELCTSLAYEKAIRRLSDACEDGEAILLAKRKL